MDTLYLIATGDKITLDTKVSEIKNKNKDAEIVFYDLTETPIERVIEDLDTYNFLTSKKIIVASNASFLSSDKNRSNIVHNLEKLEKYLESPNPDNILILVCDSLDKRKKITSTVCKKMIVVEEINDINNLLKKYLDDYKMNNNSLKLLLEYCQNNYERVLNELEKLKQYKQNEKVITEDDIKLIVTRMLDDNIFHLVDSILSKNKKYAFELYHDFILHGEQVVNIIRILSSKIRLIYQVKVLLQDGNSDVSISKLLKVHEYPIKLARESSYKYTEEVLLMNLEKLAKIDLEIKSGKSDGEVAFEMLLATI